ncbi:MAG: cell division protein FtsI [Propionibacterium sp.]|nr:MAG: cell division protein FtsI [Propionibacterium sp.]
MNEITRYKLRILRLYKARVPMASSGKRIRIFSGFIAGVLVLCGSRAFQLQAFDAKSYADEAKGQMRSKVAIQPSRGIITDRNGVALAQSQPAYKVFADPIMIARNGVTLNRALNNSEKKTAKKAPKAIAELLAKYLGGRPEHYLPKLLVEGSHYEVIQRQVPAYLYQKLKADLAKGGWHGIYSEFDPIRDYPAGTLAANVIGFVNGEGVGKGGLEYALNDKLTGSEGARVFYAGQWGRMPLGANVLTPAKNGANYKLTIDAEMQWMAEKAVASGVAKAEAATGTAIVQDIKTGEILAMATVPSFDSNDPGSADSSNLGNRAITNVYEPGSVQKIITMATLADTGIANPDEKLVVPNRIRSGNGYISDAWQHDTLYLTARGMVAKSSNIGAVQLGRKVDKKTFARYLAAFGLGAKTGIGLPGEAAGKIPGPAMADYTRDQISFGSGLSVTAIQMSTAVAAAVNDGVYNSPTIIKSAATADNKPITVPRSESRRVISSEASAMVRDVMEAVVSEGGGSPVLGIDGYRTGGKSGTATRYDESCGCYRGYTASFVGFAPADDPKLLVYVVIDKPKDAHFGSVVAGPVYKEIMQVGLSRYGVLPAAEKPRIGQIEYKP